MQIWEMDSVQFFSEFTPDVALGAMGWEMVATDELKANWQPDKSQRQWLTGANQNYWIAPMVTAPTNFVLYEAPDNWVGFYESQLIQIHEQHRRRGLAEELIIAAWSVRQLTPDMPRNLVESSEKAFRRAHEIAVRRAHGNLQPVPKRVLAE
jgi:hypothetical protein